MIYLVKAFVRENNACIGNTYRQYANSNNPAAMVWQLKPVVTILFPVRDSWYVSDTNESVHWWSKIKNQYSKGSFTITYKSIDDTVFRNYFYLD